MSSSLNNARETDCTKVDMFNQLLIPSLTPAPHIHSLILLVKHTCQSTVIRNIEQYHIFPFKITKSKLLFPLDNSNPVKKTMTVVTWIRITALVGLKSHYPFHVSTLVGS